MKNLERGDWVKGLNPARNNEVCEGYFLHLTMSGSVRVDDRHGKSFGSYKRIPLESLERCAPPKDVMHPPYVFCGGDFVEWDDPERKTCEGWYVQHMHQNLYGMVTLFGVGTVFTLPMESIRISPKDPPSIKLRTREGIGGTRVRSIPPLEPGDKVEWHDGGETFQGVFRNASCLSWVWVTRDDGYLVHAYLEKLHYLG